MASVGTTILWIQRGEIGRSLAGPRWHDSIGQAGIYTQVHFGNGRKGTQVHSRKEEAILRYILGRKEVYSGVF